MSAIQRAEQTSSPIGAITEIQRQVMAIVHQALLLLHQELRATIDEETYETRDFLLAGAYLAGALLLGGAALTLTVYFGGLDWWGLS